MLNFREFYYRTADRRKRWSPPDICWKMRSSWAQLEKWCGKMKTAFPYVFNTLFHRTQRQRAKSNSRWQVKSTHPPVACFFFFLCFLKKTFSAQWIFAHFPPVWARPGKSGLLGNSPRKSIRCGCCFGNETFHDRNGKRQRGKEHNFPMFFFFQLVSGEFATMQMEGK